MDHHLKEQMLVETINDIKQSAKKRPGKMDLPILPAQGSEQLCDLVLERVKLYAQRRIAWLQKIWTDAGSETGGNQDYTFHTEIQGCLLLQDSIQKETAWYDSQPGIKEVTARLEQVEQKLETSIQSRLTKLAITFGLNRIESDVIQACLALHLDPNLGRVYAYLQDHNGRTYVTKQLVARLFQHGAYLSIGSSSPLQTWNLITETLVNGSEPARLDCDPFILNWLLGSDDIDLNLATVTRIQPVLQPLNDWQVPKTALATTELLNKRQGIRYFIAGAEGTGKSSFAAAVCAHLGLPLLCIYSDRINTTQWSQMFMYAQRQAWLANCALLWKGVQAREASWPVHLSAYPLQFLTGELNEHVGPVVNLIDVRIEMPAINSEEIYDLCKKLLPSTVAWPKDEIMQVIIKQQPAVGSLKAVSAKEVRNATELSESLRSLSRQRLGNLAQLINASYSWDDLIVPDGLRNGLDDFYYEATERALVWENAAIKKHFPQGRGLIALLGGAPGTGKTMAAQVIASKLQLDLYRIDLSTVVSKYVGETSKNLERILSRAAGMNAILLFDEADSLFGKRTEIKDAHDRYANTDTNYLLQSIEEYPGIAILASNRKGNIDSGFTRRLRYVFDFPVPDAKYRLQLWVKLVSELAATETAERLMPQLIQLSDKLEVTGAQIKQAVLSSIFLSRRENKAVSLAHLMKGLERELVKENRGIGRLLSDIAK